MARENFEQILADLEANLGNELIIRSHDIINEVMADRSGFRSSSEPICVVFPETTEHVQTIVRIAAQHGVGIVIRGAGTGLTGASMGSAGEVVLSTIRMNKILEVDTHNGYARVQAGVINGDLDNHLRERGFWFAPDPASRYISTVGGNTATNAGGLMCAKYGVTREAVLSAEVVLADGSAITVGHRTIKGVTGLDLTALFVGSEGILGIISEITVKILPVSSHPTLTLSAYFPTVEQAARAASHVTTHNLQPLIMEIMDEACLSAVHEYLGLEAVVSGRAHLLVQFDGVDATERLTLGADILGQVGALDVQIAAPADAEELVRIRRSVHPSLARLGTTLIEDVCVPRDQLAHMFEEISRIGKKYAVSIPTVCHAGDGNLHPNFIFVGDEVPDHIWQAAGEIFRAALNLGGTLTGEHGIGVLKSRWLEDELGNRQYELQRSIKQLFDPNNIFNPGRVFPLPEAVVG